MLTYADVSYSDGSIEHTWLGSSSDDGLFSSSCTDSDACACRVDIDTCIMDVRDRDAGAYPADA